MRNPEDIAQDIAHEWIAAWNSHDLERILSHYTEDIVLVSPIVVKRLGIPSGRIEGKAVLRDYFARGLETQPGLRFELVRVLHGVGSMVLDYRRIEPSRRNAAEFMEFADDGRVRAVRAHYAEA